MATIRNNHSSKGTESLSNVNTLKHSKITSHDQQRFYKKIRIDTATGCWLWNSNGTRPDGYRQLEWRHHKYLAHRFVYVALRGDIPKGLECDHLCRVRHCVNPSHIDIVSKRTNQIRGINTLMSIAITKTHCPEGHSLISNNLVINRLKKGHRICRICKNAKNQLYKQKNREAIRKRNREYMRKKRAKAHTLLREKISVPPTLDQAAGYEVSLHLSENLSFQTRKTRIAQ